MTLQLVFLVWNLIKDFSNLNYHDMEWTIFSLLPGKWKWNKCKFLINLVEL
jgi:hypothetical protein